MEEIYKGNLEILSRMKIKNKKINKRIKNIKWQINLFPQTCEITVTHKCNLKCIFCYDEKKKSDEQPTIEVITNTLNLSRKNGSWICVVIGGEATLREDLTLIARIAKKIGYECIKICTNGIRLADEKYLKELISSGFNMFDITLMSIEPHIHDYLTGIKGNHKKLMKAFENLKKNNCEIGINTVINKLNYKSFPNLIDFTYNKLEVNYYNIIFGHYDGEFKKNIQELAVRYCETLNYIKNGLSIIEKSKIPVFARILVNFPPCLMPQYLNIIADWEIEKQPKENILLNSQIDKLYNKRITFYKKIDECKKCVLRDRCKGIDKRYLSLFGETEFSAIKNIPKQKIKTTFL